MMPLFILVILTIALFSYLWYQMSKDDRVFQALLVKSVTETMASMVGQTQATNRTFLEQISSLQLDHFEQLQQQQAQQLDLVMHMSEQIFDHFETMKELDRPIAPVAPGPDLLQENDIEKKTPEDISLTDMPRIPIVDGVNIKFEDEEESYAMNIESM